MGYPIVLFAFEKQKIIARFKYIFKLGIILVKLVRVVVPRAKEPHVAISGQRLHAVDQLAHFRFRNQICVVLDHHPVICIRIGGVDLCVRLYCAGAHRRQDRQHSHQQKHRGKGERFNPFCHHNTRPSCQTAAGGALPP